MNQTEMRRQVILDRLEREEQVYISELKKELAVSEATLRKDIQALEQIGVLRRIRGGAARTAEQPSRAHVQALARERIARRAYELLEDGDTVLLDMSLTIRELAHQIAAGGRKKLTVITPALYISKELARLKHIEVIQLGGLVRRNAGIATGPITTDDLTNLHADKAFIGVHGIDARVGLTIRNILECELKAMMVEASTRAYVLADSSKMGEVAVGVICPVNQADCIITDREISDEYAAQLRECGVELLLA